MSLHGNNFCGEDGGGWHVLLAVRQPCAQHRALCNANTLKLLCLGVDNLLCHINSIQ